MVAQASLASSMAVSLPSPILPLHTPTRTCPHTHTHYCPPTIRRRQAAAAPRLLLARASTDLLGDFGARDPFPAELESKFADKTLGNASTEHVILIPTAAALSLAERRCAPLPPGHAPLTEDQAKDLLRKVVGWRLVQDEGSLRLQCEWRLKDFSAGLQLLNRISAVAEAEGHHPDLHLENFNQVRAEIWTHSIGGLSENDFILAAKIDKVKTSDLIKKNRFWA